MRSITLLLTLAAASLPMSATAIQSGLWYQFVSDVNNNVSNGAGDSGVPAGYQDPGLPPWTFTLLSAGSLDVTDAQLVGDSYNVFNGSTLLQYTGQSAPFDPNTNCGLNPTGCFTAAGFSHTTIQLGAGSYSISLRAVDNPQFSSSGFLRVNGTLGTAAPPTTPGTDPPPANDPNAVPEPGTVLLMASALGFLVLRRRK